MLQPPLLEPASLDPVSLSIYSEWLTRLATLGGLLILSLVLVGFFATAEAALRGLSRSRYQHILEERGANLPPSVAGLLDSLDGYESVSGLGRTLATLAAAGLGIALLFQLAPTDLVDASLIASLALLILAAEHALPEPIVRGRFEETAARLALPIRLATYLLWPVSWVVDGLVDVACRLVGRRHVPTRPVESGEDLRDILGERIVEDDERDMIDGIFNLEEKATREIMIPRMDIVALPADAPVSRALQVFVDEGFSRVPVYNETIDEVTGILYAKDLFPLVRDGKMAGQVGVLARPAYFIPESKRIGELLHELQRRRVHIAIVVDEYGGTAGLVTIEDLLEEIVGEIQDEFDTGEEDKIVEGRDGEATFEATVSINDVNDTLGLHLSDEEVDTIGGLVYEQLGKMPLVGDRFDSDGATVTVLATKGRRIKKVKVTRRSAEIPPADPPSEQAIDPTIDQVIDRPIGQIIDPPIDQVIDRPIDQTTDKTPHAMSARGRSGSVEAA